MLYHKIYFINLPRKLENKNVIFVLSCQKYSPVVFLFLLLLQFPFFYLNIRNLFLKILEIFYFPLTQYLSGVMSFPFSFPREITDSAFFRIKSNRENIHFVNREVFERQDCRLYNKNQFHKFKNKYTTFKNSKMLRNSYHYDTKIEKFQTVKTKTLCNQKRRLIYQEFSHNNSYFLGTKKSN